MRDIINNNSGIMVVLLLNITTLRNNSLYLSVAVVV
jgi:hypothetical protein